MSTNNEQNNCDVHLHAEIETLKQALVEKQNQLISMETACLRESDRQAELEDSIIAWQDKYDRLYESHKRVQKVNQSLEDKLLKLVDRNSGERAQLTSDVATLSVRLAQANYNIAKLQREIERYKNDINLAIQLLQCKPDSFVPQKVSSLPMDIQSKVSSYMRLETNSHSDSEGSTSGVGVATSSSYKVLPASDSPPPLCPFPPTAMVYSMRGLDAQNDECNESSDQLISPSVMAKYLEDELKANEIKHCDTCKCSNKDLTVLIDEPKTYSIGIQTTLQGDNTSSLCLRCNSNLNSPSRTNSPYIMKLVKSSDSVISETKSSVSDFNDADKLFTPAKKDDLMVNPILGHHRLCDRTTTNTLNTNKSSLSILNTAVNTLTNTTINYHQLNNNSNGTAKYLVENQTNNNNNNNISNNNRNKTGNGNGNDDDHDLIDLNKFNINTTTNVTNTITTIATTATTSNHNSPKMAVNNDITSNHNTNNSNGNNNGLNNNNNNNNNRNQQLSDNNNKFMNNSNNSNNKNNCNSNNNGNSTSRKSDSNNLLIDTTENNSSSNDIVQGINNIKIDSSIKSDTISRSNEKKIDMNNGSSGNNLIDTKMNNLQKTSVTGSTNSLWSKTSSSEGTKIFENFNRNLIRTIKAENPKYRGPRLCALRIQNGSNNILLDSIESSSEITPIVYTRRQRFLDEELDDTKDIITSSNSMIISPISQQSPTIIGVNQNSSNTSELGRNEKILETPLSPNKQNSDEIIHNKTETNDNIENKIQQNNNSMISSMMVVINSQPPLNQSDIHCVQQNHHQQQQDSSAGSALTKTTLTGTTETYDMITLCDNSVDSSCKNTNSKSCTQSSSLSSSNCVDAIELQENALLRRQQLTRVAEWVQNNSQMEQSIHHILNNSHKALNNNNSSGNFNQTSNYGSTAFNNNNNSPHIDNRKFPLPYDNGSISIGKLSNCNDFNFNKFKKTQQQQQQQLQSQSQLINGISSAQQQHQQEIKKQIINYYHSQLTNQPNNTIPLPIPTTSTSNSLTISNCTNNDESGNKTMNNYHPTYLNSESITQNNYIMNRKYYNDENNRNLLKLQQQQQQLHEHQVKQLNCNQEKDNFEQQQQQIEKNNQKNNNDKNCNIKMEDNGSNDNQSLNQVDLAQMEYNVKQFLLKQNEWSMRSCNSSSIRHMKSSLSGSSTSTANRSNKTQIIASNNNNNSSSNNTMNTNRINDDDNSNSINHSNHRNNSTSLASATTTTTKDTIIFKYHPHRTETNL